MGRARRFHDNMLETCFEMEGFGMGGLWLLEGVQENSTLYQAPVSPLPTPLILSLSLSRCNICVCLAVKSVHTVPCLLFALIILFVSKHAAMSELVFPDWLHSCSPLFSHKHSTLFTPPSTHSFWWHLLKESYQVQQSHGCLQAPEKELVQYEVAHCYHLSSDTWLLMSQTCVESLGSLIQITVSLLARACSIMSFLGRLWPYFSFTKARTGMFYISYLYFSSDMSWKIFEQKWIINTGMK